MATETTTYYRTATGVGMNTVSDGMQFTPPEGAVVISRIEYEAEVIAFDALFRTDSRTFTGTEG